MKREDLKKLGLSDEQIEGVMSAHGKDITSLQEKVNGLTNERDGLKSQLDERDKQLVDLQKNSKNVDDLNEKIKQLQADNQKANEDWQNKLATQTKNFRIETALREAKAKNVKAVLPFIDTEKVTVDGDNLKGLDEQIKAIQQSDSYLFDEGKPEPRINIGGAFNNGENGTDGKVDPVVSSIAARMKSI
ncbi:phage scaffolding protein [Ligilactobacillus agilis]|nr:phage scaffolding protein [Ligilactobacillus agilis]MCL8205253.1 phage scaffolding protein [Ligilactobacillus agilis]MCL8206108.1 phage scaffolding protein [Ligilactobacillus agilis]MCL8206432.1 phage scaffolding protein [Ligilactobacillus agilis]